MIRVPNTTLFQACALLVALIGLSGCVMNRVVYEPRGPVVWEAVASASIVSGTPKNAAEIASRVTLPHLTTRDRIVLWDEWLDIFCEQLGSEDYTVIGSIRANGNGYATIDSIRGEMSTKAAKAGGHLVLLMDSGVESVPYSYTTPGYSYGSGSANAWAVGDHGYAQSQWESTYVPPQTHRGVNHFPWAHGLVLRLIPGNGAFRKKRLTLSDPELERYAAKLDAIKDRPMSGTEFLAHRNSALAEAASESRQ